MSLYTSWRGQHQPKNLVHAQPDYGVAPEASHIITCMHAKHSHGFRRHANVKIVSFLSVFATWRHFHPNEPTWSSSEVAVEQPPRCWCWVPITRERLKMTLSNRSANLPTRNARGETTESGGQERHAQHEIFATKQKRNRLTFAKNKTKVSSVKWRKFSFPWLWTTQPTRQCHVWGCPDEKVGHQRGNEYSNRRNTTMNNELLITALV